MKILDINGEFLLEVPGDTLRNADLQYTNLCNADLQEADLWRAKLRNADLHSVNLQYADLRYADLWRADLWRADLRFANLQYTNLWRANLRYANLRYANLCNANLQEADLWRANLRYVNLRKANLRKANLRKANLQDVNLYFVDFSEAKLKGALLPYYDETPVIPNIHKAIYEAASSRGALDMSNWHTCATTHHWAGWVIALAGEAGRKLESKIGIRTAAALIYAKSDLNLEQIPNWYASNEEALLNMRRLAA